MAAGDAARVRHHRGVPSGQPSGQAGQGQEEDPKGRCTQSAGQPEQPLRWHSQLLCAGARRCYLICLILHYFCIFVTFISVRLARCVINCLFDLGLALLSCVSSVPCGARTANVLLAKPACNGCILHSCACYRLDCTLCAFPRSLRLCFSA